MFNVCNARVSRKDARGGNPRLIFCTHTLSTCRRNKMFVYVCVQSVRELVGNYVMHFISFCLSNKLQENVRI